MIQILYFRNNNTVKKDKNRHGGNSSYMPLWIYTVLGRRWFRIDESSRRNFS